MLPEQCVIPVTVQAWLQAPQFCASVDRSAQ